MRKRNILFFALPICIALLSGCGAITVASSSPSTELSSLSTMPSAMTSIVADATVRPANYSELRFEIPGTVVEILVQEGDHVEAGAPLARLDDRDLQLAVEQARAALREAKAAYAQLEAGATPEQIAAALARRDLAQAQLTQVQGAVTSSDIAAAEAALRQAKEYLAKLQRGADPEPIAIARARVEQAQANLNAQRDTLSAAKTNAYLVMQQAVEQLTKAQSAYATAQSDWNYVQETGEHPSNPTIVDAQGNKTKNKVNDTQRQQYYNALIQAQATMQEAEYALQQAQVQFDTARQAEVTGIAAAEAQLAEAQANLDNILAKADPDQIAAAEAQVAQAQAALDKLRGSERTGQVAAAEASLRAAQANLEEITASTRAVDLDVALTRIASMEVALQQAEHNATKATLRAPFSGIIGEVNLDLGEQVNNAGPAAVIMADTSTWKIETTNLTERHVVQFDVGSSASITFDAIPDLTLSGTVSAIKPLGTDKYGDITYTVTITPEQWDERLRWLMSATVRIEP
jgi:HlyD family secretion protein